LNEDEDQNEKLFSRNRIYNNVLQKSHSILFDDKINLSTFYTHKNS